MRDSFTHKLLMTLLAGFAAASLLWMYRHFVLTAIHETSNEGWMEMERERNKPTPVKR